MTGAPHKYRGYTVQLHWGSHYRITRPDGTELWTNSFKIVREELNKTKQLTLF